MIEFFITHFNTIAASILTIAFTGYVTYRIQTKNRLAAASIKFKQTILQILIGRYPDTKYWDRAIDLAITMAIPEIDNAVMEYSHFLNRVSKRALNETWEQGKKYCREIRYDNYLKYIQNPQGRDPREIFKEHIDNLLSFAKEK